MVVLQKSDNQLYAEIVRNLKLNLKPRRFAAIARSESKVRIRTDCFYKSKVPKDHWRKKYNRHVKQSFCGFYTPAHVPFATVGDVYLDVRDLVLSTVGGDQSLEKSKNLNFVAGSHEKERRKEEHRDAGNQQILHEQKKAASISSRGGLEEIKSKLQQWQDRLSAMRAGQTYKDCLNKENVLSTVVETMKDIPIFMQEPCSSPPRLKKLFNKWRASERIDGPPAVADDLIPAFPSEITSEHEEDNIDRNDVHERCLRNFSCKLRCFYSLLCYIYHIRTRDLRTKVPLPRDFLKALKTDVLLDHNGRPLRQTRNMANTVAFSRGAHHRSSTDTTTSRLDPDLHTSPQMNTRSSFVTESPSNLFRVGPPAGNSVIESRTSFVGRKIRAREASDKIDTWEDLLEAGDKPPSNLQAPSSKVGPAVDGGCRGGITRTSFLHAVKLVHAGKIRRYGPVQHTPHNQAGATQATEQVPIWHQVASAERNGKDEGHTVALSKRRAKRSASKKASSLSDLIQEGFTKIQTKAAKSVKEKLEKHNRREKDSFVNKVLTFQPRSLYQVDLKRLKQAAKEVSEEYDKEDIRTARWYGDLEDEAQGLGVRDEPQVRGYFKKLHPFAIDDVTTLPFVQAKLCLLVQSLPVHELCPMPMQEAFLFLLVRVLGRTPGLFNEWMNHRKLPPVKSTGG